jgi:hypothetical protein
VSLVMTRVVVRLLLPIPFTLLLHRLAGLI